MDVKHRGVQSEMRIRRAPSHDWWVGRIAVWNAVSASNPYSERDVVAEYSFKYSNCTTACYTVKLLYFSTLKRISRLRIQNQFHIKIPETSMCSQNGYPEICLVLFIYVKCVGTHLQTSAPKEIFLPSCTMWYKMR